MPIEILIPTYGRAERLKKVWENCSWNSHTDLTITFVVESDDYPSIEAVKRNGLDYVINQGSKNYAGAINTAYKMSQSEFLFCGSDDLNFHDGWDLELTKVIDEWFDVYGTNDLFNPYVLAGAHATHYLVRRRYLDEIGGVIDRGPQSFLNDDYDHNFTDTEFVWTAKARTKFRPVLSSVVEHNHWGAQKASQDATYLKGMQKIQLDRDLYLSRRQLWMDVSL